MPTRHLIATLTPSTRSVLLGFLHLGGLGLVLLGLLDSSLLPILPGSMDIAIIFLASHDKKLWFYYAVMATGGSVLGGFLTYRLARKGGKKALDKRLRGKIGQEIYKRFERWGVVAIAVFAMLPPPLPVFPFVVAAGAAQYSVTKFLIALTLGRIVRYTLLAFLAGRYDGQILSFSSHHGYAILLAAIGLALLGLLFVVRLAARQQSQFLRL
jgi:membrane protein YqaA with SNARE-associated domain